MSQLIKSQTFKFILITTFCMSLYWVVGIAEYETIDAGGQTLTIGSPNIFGVLMLVMPILVAFYWYRNKLKGIFE